MSFLGKLKTIFHVDFPKLEALVKVQIFNNSNGNKIECDNKTGTLKINYAQLTESEREKVSPIVKEIYEVSGHILEEDSDKLIEDFKQKEKSASVQEVINYFKDKIPDTDLKILRAALYLRERDRAGYNIVNLKFAIRTRYGRRGNNITNLCTANYFEDWLRPLYENLLKDKVNPESAKETYLKIYSNIVEELPWTVFVSVKNSIEAIRAEVETKIDANLKYGIEFLNIHGIGGHNIEKIRTVVDELEKSYPDLQKSIQEENSRIFVRLQIIKSNKIR